MKVSFGQMRCWTSSRVTISWWRSNRSRNTSKGWPASFCRMPDLRSSPAPRSTSNTPNFRMRNGPGAAPTSLTRGKAHSIPRLQERSRKTSLGTCCLCDLRISNLQRNPQTTSLVLDLRPTSRKSARSETHGSPAQVWQAPLGHDWAEQNKEEDDHEKVFG